MRIGTVIGTVTLNRSHPSLKGASYRLAVPLSLVNLQGDYSEIAEEFVAIDELGAAIGNQVAISEGAEAAQPFRPEIKPVDAYNAAILDNIELKP
jgi:ethanolamine utilization protein EutN